MSSVENIQVFLRMRSSSVDNVGSENIERTCVHQISLKQVKMDCERCAKRQFAGRMPSAIANSLPPSIQSSGELIRYLSENCAYDSIFKFDEVFSEAARCDEIYLSTLQSAVKYTLQGHSCSLISCGPAGSGKSSSIFGEESGNRRGIGLAVLTIQDIFRLIQNDSNNDPTQQFHIEMSAVELSGNHHCQNLLSGHNRNANNLSCGSLSPDDSFTSKLSTSPSLMQRSKLPRGTSAEVELFDSPQVGVFLSGNGLKVPVRSADEAIILLRTAAANRSSRKTALPGTGGQRFYNSSRSHAVITFYVESKVNAPKDASPASVASGLKRTRKFQGLSSVPPTLGSPSVGQLQQLRLGRLQLVDLAGAAEPSPTQDSVDVFIKRSLHALGEVINGLASVGSNSSLSSNREESSSPSEHRRKLSVSSVSSGHSALSGGHHHRIPYLDSKLTYLLKDSFGGLSKTCMLFHVSPLVQDYQQTVPYLHMAVKARQVLNHVRPIHLLTIPEEVLDLKFDSFLVSQLKAEFVSTFEADILTSRSFSRTSTLAAPVPVSNVPKKFNQRVKQQLAYGANSKPVRSDKTASVSENQQPHLVVAESIISAEDTYPFSPPVHQLTLSEKMREKLGDDYNLVLNLQADVVDLQALDHTVAVARSIQTELEAELHRTEAESVPERKEEDLSQLIDRESKRCGRYALISDLQELDLVSRLALKLRNTSERLQILQQRQQQQVLLPETEADHEVVRESCSPIGVSPEEMLRNGDFLDSDNEDCKVAQPALDFSMSMERTRDMHSVDVFTKVEKDELSTLLRQRVDDLRETLQHLHQNQSVALESCFEALLQVAETKRFSDKTHETLEGSQNNRRKILKSLEQEEGDESEASSSDNSRSGSSKEEKESNLTPMSSRSAPIMFEEQYSGGGINEEQYMRNPLLKKSTKLVNPWTSGEKNIDSQRLGHRAVKSLPTNANFLKPLASQEPLATQEGINIAELLELALRENRSLQKQLEEAKTVSSNSSSLVTANTTKDESSAIYAMNEMLTMLKSERSEELRQAQLDLAIARQDCERSARTIEQLQNEISSLQLRIVSEQITVCSEEGLTSSGYQSGPGIRLSSSQVTSSQPWQENMIIRSSFSKLASIYTVQRQRPFFAETDGDESSQPSQPMEQQGRNNEEPHSLYSREALFDWEFHPEDIDNNNQQISTPFNHSGTHNLISRDDDINSKLKSLTDELSAVTGELELAKLQLKQHRSDYQNTIFALNNQLQQKEEELSTIRLSYQQSPRSPTRIKRLEQDLAAKDEEAASLNRENQQLRYEVAFKAKLVANANRSVADLLTLLSEKNDELQLLSAQLLVLQKGPPNHAQARSSDVPLPIVFPGAIDGGEKSRERELEKNRSRSRALALVMGGGLTPDIPGCVVPAPPLFPIPPPLTSKTAESLTENRPISPLTEDSLSVIDDNVDAALFSSKRNDPDQAALEHGLLLSLQNQRFGTDMYESLTKEYEPVVAEYIRRGFSREDACLLIFEARFGKVPLDQALAESKNLGGITQPNIPVSEEGSELPLFIRVACGQAVGTKESDPVAHNESHPSVRAEEIIRPSDQQNFSAFEEQEQEIRQIMSRGYAKELAEEIYFKIQSHNAGSQGI